MIATEIEANASLRSAEFANGLLYRIQGKGRPDGFPQHDWEYAFGNRSGPFHRQLLKFSEKLHRVRLGVKGDLGEFIQAHRNFPKLSRLLRPLVERQGKGTGPDEVVAELIALFMLRELPDELDDFAEVETTVWGSDIHEAKSWILDLLRDSATSYGNIYLSEFGRLAGALAFAALEIGNFRHVPNDDEEDDLVDDQGDKLVDLLMAK